MSLPSHQVQGIRGRPTTCENNSRDGKNGNMAGESQQFSQPISKVYFELLIKPILGMVTDEEAAEKHAADSIKILDVYEARLSQSKHLAGDEFTLTDCNHMTWLNMLMMTKKACLVNDRPYLKAWWETVSARPAWQKTAAAK